MNVSCRLRYVSARRKVLLMFAAFFMPLLSAVAQPSVQKGLEIAREADRRDSGWRNSHVEVEMILRNREGQEAQRKMSVRSLEVQSDGDKILIVFDWPKDMARTALLTHSHKTGNDDQWLFLPALRRVKRISGANKSGSFVGSEFAYEDLTSPNLERYTYRFLRNETCGPWECFVVDRFPVDKDSGYTRQTMWIDDDEYRLTKVIYYDRKNSVLKTLILKNYKNYLDRFWRAHVLKMENHQTGRSTEILYQEYKFRLELSDQHFRPDRLTTLR